MCRVNRQLQALAAAAIATLALTPLSADAATPSPSPSLDKVLAPPPSSDFAELTTGVLHGQFDAHDWATTNSTGSAATYATSLARGEGVSINRPTVRPKRAGGTPSDERMGVGSSVLSAEHFHLE